jgi:Helix-turn-helix of DDE superfamily endonuclease
MTGLSPEQLDLLCDRIADQIGPWQPLRGRHRTLDLAAAVTMTLIWLRHNLSPALLGAFHGISQPTVSRVITSLRERIIGASGSCRAWPIPNLASGCWWTAPCCPPVNALASRDRGRTAASGTRPG